MERKTKIKKKIHILKPVSIRIFQRNRNYSVCVCMCLCAQSCLTLCNPMGCRLPGSSVHGIFQARILEWVAFSFSRGTSLTKDQTHVSCVPCVGRFFTTLPPGKLFAYMYTYNTHAHNHMYLYMCILIHFKELVHVIVEAGNSKICRAGNVLVIQ